MHVFEGLQQIGLAHDHADLATRERLTPVLRALVITARTLDVPHVELATCHRHELYWLGDLPLESVADDLVEGSLQHRGGEPAVAHLLAVASGRASVVLGETEILGQVRRACHASQDAEASSLPLDGLFERVIGAARRVRRAVASAGPADTISAAGVRLAMTAITAPMPRVLILGAGDAAQAAARAVRAAAPEARMLIMARRRERSAALASEVGATVGVWEELAPAIGGADLVVAATSARTPVLTATTFHARRPGLVLLDLAVPRNIEPVVGSFHGFTLLDLDDIARDCHAMAAPTAAWDAALAEALTRLGRATTVDLLPEVLSALHARGDAVAEADADTLADALGLDDLGQRALVRDALRRAVRRALFPASRALRGETATLACPGEAQRDPPR